MARTEGTQSQAECLTRLKALDVELDRLVTQALPSSIGNCTGQIGPQIISATNGERSGFWVNHRIVTVEEATNSRGLLIAEADSAKDYPIARTIARVIAGQNTRPTQILVYPAEEEETPLVVLDVGVGRVCFTSNDWSFAGPDKVLAIEAPEGAEAAIKGMWFLMHCCGLPVEPLRVGLTQLNSLSKDKSESTRQAQGMIDTAIRNLVGVAKKTPDKFDIPKRDRGSAEWVAMFRKTVDAKLAGATEGLLTRFSIDAGALHLLDSNVHVGGDPDLNPVIGFSDGNGILIINLRETGSRLRIYKRDLDSREKKPEVNVPLNNPKDIGAALEWTAACQEFLTPTK